MSMHEAARFGDIPALERLLAAGADINAPVDLNTGCGKYWRQLTPLMVAASSQEGATVETLQWLLEHGANLSATSAAGYTAIWYAAGNGRWQEAQSSSSQLRSPAASAPNPAAKLEFLLSQGQGMQDMRRQGADLLTAACTVGDPARVRLLLNWGAPLHPQPKRQQQQAQSDYLHDPWHDQPMSFEIPLFCALESDSAECVQLLLEAGTDPNLRNFTGDTPIMMAANVAIFRQLLAAGADPYAVDTVGRDAFQQFVSQPADIAPDNMMDELSQLVDLGMNVNATLEPNGWTRLFVAAFELDDVATERLLAMGADPHLGRPTLSGFCWHFNDTYNENIARGIKLLVAAGCDVNAQDAAGDTLLHNASLGYSHALNEDCFNSSSDGCNYTAVKTLLELGAQPDPVGTGGHTPLMNAVEDSCPPAVEALLSAGADPNRPNDKGETAIDLARAIATRCDGYRESTEDYQRKMYDDAIACLNLLRG